MTKGLQLGDAAVANKRARDDAATAVDALELVKEMVAAMGIRPFPQPSKELPPLGTTDTGHLAPDAIEAAYTGYVGYMAFLGPKVAEAVAAYRIADANLKRIKANLKVKLLKEGCPAKEVDARAVDAPEYLEYDLERLKLSAVKEILEAHYASYKDQAAALSRIIELRKLEFENGRREGNMGRRYERRGTDERPRSPGRRME